MSAIIIQPPSNLTLLNECADWLELVSLIADDGNASAGDLERLIRRGGIFGSAKNEDEAIEAYLNSVLVLLAERAMLAGDHYPFLLEGTKLQKRFAIRP